MGRDKTAEARLGGMDYAVRQIESHGIDAFRKELSMRNRNGIDWTIPMKEIERNQSAITEFLSKWYLTVALAVLNDEFECSQDECIKFRDRFMSIVDSFNGDYATIQDYIDTNKEELGIEVVLS